jgi:hypothetical protein
MKLSRMLATVVGLTAAVSMSMATVAWAQPIQEEDVFQETEIVDDFCDVAGLTVQVDITVNSRVMLNTHGPDGLAYEIEHLRITRVATNVANGNTTTLEERAMQKDLHVTDNGDGTLTIIAFVTGTAVVYDPEGKAIARNAGQTRVEVLVDHGGTLNDRSDDVLLEERIVRESGRSEDFCAASVSVLVG